MEFDPSAYLDAPIEKPLERRPPLMASDYTAVIEDLQARSWVSKDKIDPLTGQLKGGIAFDVVLSLEVPESERTRLNLPPGAPFKLTDSIMLDLTPSRAIDDSPGKNTRLRMYREATGQNKPGEVFRPKNLIGRPIRVKVGHRALPSGDPTEEVKMVGALGTA